MVGCGFQLLGNLKITFDEEEFTKVISGAKVRLLAYLVLAIDMPQRRKKIAFDLWQDSSEKQALSNLRKLIHDLRECFPQIDPYLKITPAYIQWNHELPFYSDVREFEQAANGRTLYELRIAEELYRGELLPGFYEEWLGAKREQLAQTYLNVLDNLISILESQREYSSALFFANKLLAHNKLREETYRTLMRLHALKKDKAGVMQIYRQLHNILQTELGIDPADETKQLMEKLTQNVGEHSTAAYSSKPLIARIGEWGNLLSAWKQAIVSRNALLILKGEAGIGKTRLALEFQAWAESQGDQTVYAGCYQSLRSLSYTPIITWLRSLPLPQLSPIWLSELARLLPELLVRYPDLPKPNAIQENWQLNHWYEAMERMLLAKQPLLLILDDIQWSDVETLQLLSYLFRSDSKARLFVIATMRTDEKLGDAVEHFVSGLRIERKLTEIELAPLSVEETNRLMAETVGDALAERHSLGLHAKTGGNPLFIVETLREWQTGNDKSEFRLTPLAKTVIENRLNKLSRDNRQLVSTFAAIGRPVSTAFMVMVSDLGEEEILEKIEQLLQWKVMQEVGDGKYDFTHDFIRETAYKVINEGRRRQCHRQIASGLSAFHQEHPESVAAEIAFHYELAGMEKEAIDYYEMAALAAEKIYANETRIKYYQKLCVLLPSEQILPVLMDLGDALILVGDWKEAEKTYRQWFERSGNFATIKERSFCDVALGNCLRLLGTNEEASFHLERALHYFELTGDHSGLSLVYGTLGIFHYYLGNYDEALHVLMKRMELPDVGNRTRDDCRFLSIIGRLFYDQCEYEQAVHWFKKHIELATENRDSHSIERAMGALAIAYMDMDEMDRAFGLIVDKMEISKSIGDRMGFAVALGMLGKYYLLQGDGAQAALCIAFCLEEAVLIKDLRVVAIMLSYEGRILMAQQRLEEADLLIGRSIRLSKQVRTPYYTCEMLYFKSLLKQRQSQSESAMEIAEEALDLAYWLKRRDMQVRLLVHMSHLKTILRRITPVEAVDQLQNMLKQYPDQQEQAAIRFAMWKLNTESPELLIDALSFNEELYRKSGKEEYLDRCGEMNGFCHAASARPMPQLAAVVTQSKRISPEIVEEIDRYLNL